MPGSPFLSHFRKPRRRTTHKDHTRRCVKKSSGYISQTHQTSRQQHGLRWFESPIDEKGQLYRHSDATPIELFFDLFFVANLSTFTATHEINDVEGTWPLC